MMGEDLRKKGWQGRLYGADGTGSCRTCIATSQIVTYIRDMCSNLSSLTHVNSELSGTVFVSYEADRVRQRTVQREQCSHNSHG